MLTYICAIGGIVAGCIITGGRANVSIGAAFLLSLAMAVYADANADPTPMALSMALCSMIALYGWTTASTAIAALYAVRLIFLAAFISDIITLSAFWKWNEGWLLLQMLIATGGIVSPALARRTEPSTFLGNIIHRYDFLMSQRL